MSQGRPGSGIFMWQGMQRSLCVTRAALGTTYVLWSARATGRASAVAGILGTRHLAQALLTADQPTSAVLLLGAEADTAHAASMAALAAMPGRWRRYALGDALVAASLAAVGLICAANAPASDPGAGGLLARRDRWADSLARRLPGLPGPFAGSGTG
jgi:hypothetical protein